MRKTQKIQKTKKPIRNVSEQELLETIENISKKLSYKFKFGYHETEDMRQQISVFALEGLEKYDYTRPLENFLWTHVRNRLFNFKRDNYQRPDKPCVTCPFYDKLCANKDMDCKEFSNKQDCELYKGWYDRNNAKKNLMYLNTIEDLRECIPMSSKGSERSGEANEVVKLLEEELTGEHRTIYLKLKYGARVYKFETEKLFNKIQEILNVN